MAPKGKPKQPKAAYQPKDKVPILGVEPLSYLRETPVWRFQSFDWDGPWGLDACASGINWRKHIEQHLAAWETMTWAELMKASGGKGKGKGTNHHPMRREKFTKEARYRLKFLQIYSEELFSFRFDNCARLYGVREGACFRIVWFDPYHCDKGGKAAYDWKSK